MIYENFKQSIEDFILTNYFQEKTTKKCTQTMKQCAKGPLVVAPEGGGGGGGEGEETTAARQASSIQK